MAASISTALCSKSLWVFRKVGPRTSSCLFVRHRSGAAFGARPVKNYHIEDPDLDEEFRVLIIPGHTKIKEQKVFMKSRKKEVPPSRSKLMNTDQDWTNVWPSAYTFKWSAIPFPVRQGMVDRVIENQGIPPGRYGNAELMKIPNFLHLTPNHIKKQCAAMKKFCNQWPEGLETDRLCDKHFPLVMTTCDYFHDAPSPRDARARLVKVQVKLSHLDLDYHAQDKMKRLVGDGYDSKSDAITLMVDRCPTKQQNYNYAMYLLTVLYHESWKTEPWEMEKTEADMEKYVWDMTASRKGIVKLIQQLKQAQDGDEKVSLDDLHEEDIVSTAPVQEYKQSVEDLHNCGESVTTLEQYKESIRNLFNIQKLETS